MLYLIGAVSGTLILVLSALLIFPKVLPPIYQATSPPYITYFLTAIVLFMFMSEWPKEGDRGKTPPSRGSGWPGSRYWPGCSSSSSRGGSSLPRDEHQPPADHERLHELTPMFIGFFGMSWVLLNILSNPPMLEQVPDDRVESSPYNIAKASFGGASEGR